MTGRISLLDTLHDHVLLCDGAMGSCLQDLNLDIEKDYWGNENCSEILTLARPDLIRSIHTNYYKAGADIVETNSFGASPVTLSEFNLQDKAFELNEKSAILAREAAESFSDGRTRFVLGSIGPGTRLASLGAIDYDTLEEAYSLQARGLITGGVDGLLIETCQDLLQIKAAINGVRDAQRHLNVDLPIFVHVTIETTGTLLTGSDIAAAATVLHAMNIDLMGLNCATGPREMMEHVQWLSEHWPHLLSALPNAGLPELIDGQTCYPLSPRELAHWLKRFVVEQGVNMIGGCCGTNFKHIGALDEMLRGRAPKESMRPAPQLRKSHWVPSVASLYNSVPLRQENAYFSIGERCNANGSKRWRTLQEEQDWDGCVRVGRQQVSEGSHALDICTAFTGRDERADMDQVVKRFTSSVNSPLVIDSTEEPVLRSALKLHGGKPIINSINFEDGEAPAARRLSLAREFGCSVIGLTIDEKGMARTAKDKVRIARRLVDFACNKHHLPQSDLFIDPLTFTIATGTAEDRKLGLWTLQAIEEIHKEFPDIQIVLGLSNISFGLHPPARALLNSVFLHLAMQAGMTAAIVHVSKIRSFHTIDGTQRKLAEDLIYDRRTEEYDPLSAFLKYFTQHKTEETTTAKKEQTPQERLKNRIIEGDRKDIETDLDAALKTTAPLDIINHVLLDGMKTVGELFGSGQMQLPFVLQSAQTMKAAVSYLEPLMEQSQSKKRGRMVLATVKGDVHDIGKNLVDIILTNNGYEIFNLGIKIPVHEMIDAAKKYKADAIGMSGLLVKSTVIMKENLKEIANAGLHIPVLLGGAALTRSYVEQDCVEAYQPSGLVAYARDAFDGLTLMDHVVKGTFADYVAERQEKKQKRKSTKTPTKEEDISVDRRAIVQRRRELTRDEALLKPPFLGARHINVTPSALMPFLNKRALYQGQWGFRKQGRSLDDFMKWADKELQPIVHRLLKTCEADSILQPRGAYGFFKAASNGNDLILFKDDGQSELTRFSLPRQKRQDGDCIADYVRDIQDGPQRDIIGLQIVTMGESASRRSAEYFKENRYQDYLYLHGFSVEMAEAMAEYVHKHMRSELGLFEKEGQTSDDLTKQHYQGARYSFGYPACPNLSDQEKIISLLDATSLGITLSEGDQIHPEQSTSALVIFNQHAHYFII